jgi:hypothetical protein
VITYALEIVRDFDRRDDESQIARHGLLERQKTDGLILDLELQRVELTIARDDRFGHAGVAGEQRIHRQIEERRREVRHVEQSLLQV